MTVPVVARKDFQDAVRSYWLWGLSVLFIVFFTVPAYFFADRIGNAAQQQGQQLTSDAFLGILAEINAFFIPIIAIVLTYAAVAGERDSGTLKLLLSLPHSRRDVVAGKVLGRGGVIALPVLAGFVAAAVVFLVTPVDFEAGNYVLFALLSALLGLVFVAIGVGISAGARNSRRAMIGTVGIYVVFTLFWNRFANGLFTLLSDHTDLGNASLVKIHLFTKILNPTQAYKSLTAALTTDSAMGARLQLVGGMQGQIYGQVLGDSLPFYLSDPAVLLLFLSWLVVIPVAGYLVFHEADL